MRKVFTRPNIWRMQTVDINSVPPGERPQDQPQGTYKSSQIKMGGGSLGPSWSFLGASLELLGSLLGASWLAWRPAEKRKLFGLAGRTSLRYYNNYISIIYIEVVDHPE